MSDIQGVEEGKNVPANGGKDCAGKMEKEPFRDPIASFSDDVIHGIEHERDDHNEYRGLELQDRVKGVGVKSQYLRCNPVKKIPEEKKNGCGENHDKEADGVEQRRQSVSEEAALACASADSLQSVSDGGNSF